jgi:RecA-family ATPase
MTHYEQAQRYIAAIPGAVSGNGGHSQTYTVAVALAHGFALSEDDALALLQEYNQTCQPQWSERELRHKIAEAIAKPHDKPRGHLCGKNSTPSAPRPKMAAVKPEQATRERRYALNPETRLPDPLPDGARALLLAAFREGEGVRICHATFNEEGHEIPRDGGVSLSREGWLQRLDKHQGDPNGIFWTATDPKPGIYITVNPMKVGGASDSDVTGFRHCLVEFDSISKAEQFNLYEQSRLPCTAIISSGGKSVHAWVKVDARDRREYDERVQTIYKHFEAYGLDAKNKNPSRFSRLPNCVRLTSRQELLALNTGCESFSEWLAEVQAEGIGETFNVDRLYDFKPGTDANCILGDRWICRGGSLLLVGPSGVGKSSLAVQMAVAWAVGRPAFGIAPVRPLKSVIIQAENDEGDLAEMVQGVLAGMSIDPFATPEEWALVQRNVIFVTDSTHTGFAFTQALQRIVDKHKPDIGWLDPLLSFIGDDISKQSVCSQFLRNWINPISSATGTAWAMVHHTGKPPGDKKAQDGYTLSDHAYKGIGSSELVNWARAALILRQIDDHSFELKLAKRGKRAGAVQPDGTPTTSLFLKHARTGILWQQIDPPAEDEKPERRSKKKTSDKEGGGRPSKIETVKGMNLHSFCAACLADGETQNVIAHRLENWLATEAREDVGFRTCIEAVKALVGTGKLAKKDGLYFKGNNA